MAKYVLLESALNMIEGCTGISSWAYRWCEECLLEDAVDLPICRGWQNALTNPPRENGIYIVYAPTYRSGSSSGKENRDGIMFSKFQNGRWSIEAGYYDRPGCVTHYLPKLELPTK